MPAAGNGGTGAPAVQSTSGVGGAGGGEIGASAGAGAGSGGRAPVVGGAGAGVGGAGGAGAGAGGAAASASAGSGGAGGGGGGVSGGTGGAAGSELDFAAELDELFVHDACTADYPPQPDTCLHEQKVESEITFGGQAGVTYDVTVRVRGLFEPTTISGGQAPLQDHRYFKVGGSVSAADYSQWHIEVSNPAQTYWLNHYPSTSHTIYYEDFEATLAIAGGATVAVGATDGNDREIDNAEEGLADRRKLIEGVTDEVLDGQMLRLDVIAVEAR